MFVIEFWCFECGCMFVFVCMKCGVDRFVKCLFVCDVDVFVMYGDKS